MTTPRVLVVEDDDAVRVMLQKGLQRDGFEVVAASNVRDALRMKQAQDQVGELRQTPGKP
jgi:DNA-binding response OmpR family regulator